MVGPVCVREVITEACATLFWAILNLLVLLKTVLTFNHKSNDAIVSKIDHTF